MLRSGGGSGSRAVGEDEAVRNGIGGVVQAADPWSLPAIRVAVACGPASEAAPGWLSCANLDGPIARSITPRDSDLPRFSNARRPGYFRFHVFPDTEPWCPGFPCLPRREPETGVARRAERMVSRVPEHLGQICDIEACRLLVTATAVHFRNLRHVEVGFRSKRELPASIPATKVSGSEVAAALFQ